MDGSARVGRVNVRASNDVMARVADLVRCRRTASIAVADVACGDGERAVVLATLYGQIRVDGFDRDDGNIAVARRRAAAAEVDDRVRFELGHPRDLAPYDLVIGTET
jgi:ubiquinone/menaquinone biosynthesis C-methylase UbiE